MTKRGATIRRVDGNQAEIVSALRAIGATVQHLHTIGKGCPDLLVGFRGENYLLEVKKDSKAKLTPDEVGWQSVWKGSIFTVSSVTEAVYRVSMGSAVEDGMDKAGL